jgi:glycerophosphoryl diester phosphodiesterase
MTQIFGHRGASADKRENTLAAFTAAARLGADGVELDVRRTADGAMAVHHDAALADGRVIVEMKAAALPDHVPLLDAALRACAPMRVNIEIKNVPIDPDYDPTEAVAADVVELVDAMGVADRVIVSSFGLAAIDRVRALDPSFATVTAELVNAAHAAGVAINAWTIDDPSEMKRLAELGVDSIITNDVALAVATLR